MSPQSRKTSLRKNGHTFLQEILYLTGTTKYKISRYKTALGNFEISRSF